MQTQVAPNVIAIGRAVLGFNRMTIRAKYALLDQATTAELVATKLLLEEFHSNDISAIRTVAIEIRTRKNSVAA